MPKLVLLSYTATLDLLVEGKIAEKDLAEAIFIFGCSKDWPHANPDTIIREQTPFQRQQLTPEVVHAVSTHLLRAESEQRAIWRRDTSQSWLYQRINEVFSRYGLELLNPNLPPITDNGFLKSAIERVNNKDDRETVRVIADSHQLAA